MSCWAQWRVQRQSVPECSDAIHGGLVGVAIVGISGRRPRGVACVAMAAPRWSPWL